MKQKLSRLARLALSYAPSKLPVGMAEFNKFADDIIDLSGEYADRDSMAFAIASQIIHLDAKKGSIAKQYFIRSLRKAAANQVASQVFQDIKQKQQAALDAAKAEATAQEAVANEEKA